MLKNLHFYDEIDSTNTRAYELALEGAREGEVVIADAQWGGKGRFDRRWHSPPGKNIYVSFILRPPISLPLVPQITPAAGIAVAEVISSYCPGRTHIKWPNDVQIESRKVAGILTEAKGTARHLDFVILGIGINVNMERNDFPPDLQDKATSLFIETKSTVCRLRLLKELFFAWEKWYEAVLKGGFRGIKQTFLSYSPLLGKKVQVIYQKEEILGEVVDMDDEGAINIKDSRGQIHKITAGEISILGE
jgi:BirA family biotin operon repressor/biotin-[acetyl-CoA-carboxylase] ligase